MGRRQHCWQPHGPLLLTHALKCHKTNRTGREMHYLNFYHYFSPWLPLFLLIYFLVCFPQAVLLACISSLSFFSRQQPAPFRSTGSCPAFFRLSRLSSRGSAGGTRQQSSTRLGKMWPGHGRDNRGQCHASVSRVRGWQHTGWGSMLGNNARAHPRASVASVNWPWTTRTGLFSARLV